MKKQKNIFFFNIQIEQYSPQSSHSFQRAVSPREMSVSSNFRAETSPKDIRMRQIAYDSLIKSPRVSSASTSTSNFGYNYMKEMEAMKELSKYLEETNYFDVCHSYFFATKINIKFFLFFLQFSFLAILPPL